jgi:hypothetical protein
VEAAAELDRETKREAGRPEKTEVAHLHLEKPSQGREGEVTCSRAGTKLSKREHGGDRSKVAGRHLGDVTKADTGTRDGIRRRLGKYAGGPWVEAAAELDRETRPGQGKRTDLVAGRHDVVQAKESIELLRLPLPPRPRLHAAPGAWPPPLPPPPPVEVQVAAIVHELARGGLV